MKNIFNMPRIKRMSDITKLMAEMERKLDAFKSAKEWPDFISLLTSLDKTLKKLPPLNSVNDLPIHFLNKRLCRCLNPSLPAGVHNKAIQTYSIILEMIAKVLKKKRPTDEEANVIFGNFLLGVFSFSIHTKIQTKNIYYDFIEKQVMTLNLDMSNYIRNVLIAILPGLEDTGHIFMRSDAILKKLATSFTKEAFWCHLWNVFLVSPDHRASIINFLLKNKYLVEDIPPLEDKKTRKGRKEGENKEDRPKNNTIFYSMSESLVVSALKRGLQSKESIIVRGSLDILLAFFNFNDFTNKNKAELVDDFIIILTQKDISLNKRIDSIMDRNNTELRKLKKRNLEYTIEHKPINESMLVYDFIVLSLRKLLEGDKNSVTLFFRILTLFTDKSEISDYLMEKLFVQSLYKISEMRDMEEHQTLINKFTIFIENSDMWFVWYLLYKEMNYLCSEVDIKRQAVNYESCKDYPSKENNVDNNDDNNKEEDSNYKEHEIDNDKKHENEKEDDEKYKEGGNKNIKEDNRNDREDDENDKEGSNKNNKEDNNYYKEDNENNEDDNNKEDVDNKQKIENITDYEKEDLINIDKNNVQKNKNGEIQLHNNSILSNQNKVNNFSDFSKSIKQSQIIYGRLQEHQSESDISNFEECYKSTNRLLEMLLYCMANFKFVDEETSKIHLPFFLVLLLKHKDNFTFFVFSKFMKYALKNIKIEKKEEGKEINILHEQIVKYYDTENSQIISIVLDSFISTLGNELLSFLFIRRFCTAGNLFLYYKDLYGLKGLNKSFYNSYFTLLSKIDKNAFCKDCHKVYEESLKMLLNIDETPEFAGIEDISKNLYVHLLQNKLHELLFDYNILFNRKFEDYMIDDFLKHENVNYIFDFLLFCVEEKSEKYFYNIFMVITNYYFKETKGCRNMFIGFIQRIYSFKRINEYILRNIYDAGVDLEKCRIIVTNKEDKDVLEKEILDKEKCNFIDKDRISLDKERMSLDKERYKERMPLDKERYKERMPVDKERCRERYKEEGIVNKKEGNIYTAKDLSQNYREDLDSNIEIIDMSDIEIGDLRDSANLNSQIIHDKNSEVAVYNKRNTSDSSFISHNNNRIDFQVLENVELNQILGCIQIYETLLKLSNRFKHFLIKEKDEETLYGTYLYSGLLFLLTIQDHEIQYRAIRIINLFYQLSVLSPDVILGCDFTNFFSFMESNTCYKLFIKSFLTVKLICNSNIATLNERMFSFLENLQGKDESLLLWVGLIYTFEDIKNRNNLLLNFIEKAESLELVHEIFQFIEQERRTFDAEQINNVVNIITSKLLDEKNLKHKLHTKLTDELLMNEEKYFLTVLLKHSPEEKYFKNHHRAEKLHALFLVRQSSTIYPFLAAFEAEADNETLKLYFNNSITTIYVIFSGPKAKINISEPFVWIFNLFARLDELIYVWIDLFLKTVESALSLLYKCSDLTNKKYKTAREKTEITIQLLKALNSVLLISNHEKLKQALQSFVNLNFSLLKNPRFELTSILLYNLNSLTKSKKVAKTWINSYFECFMEGSFFLDTRENIEIKVKLMRRLIKLDASKIFDLYEKLDGSGFFASKESEISLKTSILKRISFMFFCTDKDNYTHALYTFIDKIVDYIHTNSIDIKREAFFLIRIIMYRFDPSKLFVFWPVLFTNINQFFDRLLNDKIAKNEYPVLVEILKLLEVFFVLQVPQSIEMKWSYIDSYDVDEEEYGRGNENVIDYRREEFDKNDYRKAGDNKDLMGNDNLHIDDKNNLGKNKVNLDNNDNVLDNNNNILSNNDIVLDNNMLDNNNILDDNKNILDNNNMLDNNNNNILGDNKNILNNNKILDNGLSNYNRLDNNKNKDINQIETGVLNNNYAGGLINDIKDVNLPKNLVDTSLADKEKVIILSPKILSSDLKRKNIVYFKRMLSYLKSIKEESEENEKVGCFVIPLKRVPLLKEKNIKRLKELNFFVENVCLYHKCIDLHSTEIDEKQIHEDLIDEFLTKPDDGIIEYPQQKLTR